MSLFNTTYIKKNFKKHNRNRRCNWCAFPIAFWGANGKFHSRCVQQPDYHNFDEFWAWMLNKKRPTGDYRRARKLTKSERSDFESWEREQEWKMEKEQGIIYD